MCELEVVVTSDLIRSVAACLSQARSLGTGLLPLPRGIFVFLTAIPTSHGGQVCVQAPCFKVDRVATGTDST